MADFSTLEEHREYLDGIVKLKLWFLWNWLRRHPDETFGDVLRKRVDIYRKTHLNTEGLCPAEKFDDRRTALYMAGAIWTVNVLDTILFYPASSKGLYSQVGSGGELYAGFRLEF